VFPAIWEVEAGGLLELGVRDQPGQCKKITINQGNFVKLSVYTLQSTMLKDF
jgi:hypothetical protein